VYKIGKYTFNFCEALANPCKAEEPSYGKYEDAACTNAFPKNGDNKIELHELACKLSH